MPSARVRVAAYVTRPGPTGPELLVFDHRDQPEAGTQIPAGGVAPGELLAQAVLREVREETGAIGLVLGPALAVQQRPHPRTGQPRVTVFFYIRTAETRASWPHTVNGQEGDGDSGMDFDCFFVPLREAAGLLVDGQGEFIPLLMGQDGPFTGRDDLFTGRDDRIRPETTW
ncbi:NUDIX hydrolase [Streptomyces mesophilus]|uniref:NUDIX hydrolase n=1 Tax=Streptomyces mesophilus TaxID=1775132 RepID=UPI0033338005